MQQYICKSKVITLNKKNVEIINGDEFDLICKYIKLRKELLRVNMINIELALTNIGELTVRDISIDEHPKELKENMSVVKRSGKVAKNARNLYERATKKSAISKDNLLNYKYIGDKICN